MGPGGPSGPTGRARSARRRAAAGRRSLRGRSPPRAWGSKTIGAGRRSRAGGGPVYGVLASPHFKFKVQPPASLPTSVASPWLRAAVPPPHGIQKSGAPSRVERRRPPASKWRERDAPASETSVQREASDAWGVTRDDTAGARSPWRWAPLGALRARAGLRRPVQSIAAPRCEQWGRGPSASMAKRPNNTGQ